MRAGRKARRGQRSGQQIAVVDRKPHGLSIADVEVGMRDEKRLRFAIGRIGKTIDVMMAVTLGVGDADQRAKREILLHAKPRLTGEVLAADEISLAANAPF